MVRNYRKPGAVVMPKTLLRFSGALSSVDDMGPGTTFQSVIDDPSGIIIFSFCFLTTF